MCKRPNYITYTFITKFNWKRCFEFSAQSKAEIVYNIYIAPLPGGSANPTLVKLPMTIPLEQVQAHYGRPGKQLELLYLLKSKDSEETHS